VSLGASEHALLELRLVGTTLCRLLDDWARSGGPATSLFAHLVEACATQLMSLTGPLPQVDREAPEEALGFAAAEELLRARLAATDLADTPLTRLREGAGLDALDVELLLLAALAESSSTWSSLFEALAGAGVKRPTVHLALHLWVTSPAERVALQLRLDEGRLVALGLLELSPRDVPLPSRQLILPERLWPALLGGRAVEPVLEGQVETAAAPPGPPVLSARSSDELAAVAEEARRSARTRLVLRGPIGSGRRQAACWLAAQLGREIIEVRWPAAAPAPGWAAALTRHALVRNAALVILVPPGLDAPVQLDAPLPDGVPAFLVAAERGEVLGRLFEGADVIHFEPPGADERAELWREALARAGVVGAPEPAELGRVFRLRGAEVAAVVHEAARRVEREQRDVVALADLALAVRERPARKLELITRRRRPQASWDDLVLPEDHLAQMRELTHRVRHRDRVFEEWGISGHSGRQQGVVALFTGPSGTGKTLAAEVIAGELGLDLYCVDLAQTISKYIGETEKGLARIFDAAEGSSAVLFFDEADALFGKRTETRDAHDRYANQVVSYLLTRLESFDGITILASNLRQNIDAAFLRRMDSLIEFVQPDIPARVQIWEKHLRGRVPLGASVNAQWLAESFPISGAHIRNAVVAAAFGAAADGQVLGLRHLAAAMRREYQKLGKSFPVRL